MSITPRCILSALACSCGAILLLVIGLPDRAQAARGCAKPTKGSNASDELTGTGLRELLRGRGGADVIRGRDGSDCLFGGPGGDVIRSGHGSDRVRGGRGNDRVYARDGHRDVIRCGPGRDRAAVDRRDVVHGNHCEQVSRRKALRSLGTPPETTIDSGPTGTITTSSASFSFSASEDASTFQCKLDSAAWAACTSPKSYAALDDGAHTFSVRATDAAANTDASPATRSITVDTPEPLYSVGNLPDSSWSVFSNASPWNTPIDGSRVAANSDAMIRKMVADGPPATESPTSNQNWGIPTYFARSSDPLYTLNFTGNFDYTREIDGQRIHVPAGAAAAGGSDGVIWVVDQTDGFVYAMQQATVNHSTRVIDAWKGYRLDAEGLGFRYPSGPPTGVQPIRPEELEAGYVNHAMSLGARCLSGHPVAPFDQSLTVGKTCSGDTNPATTRLSMGNVVFLDMSHAQINALSVPTWQRAILKGLADYGAVVGLNGGAPWSLKFENRLDRTSLGKPDPYAAAGLPSNLSFANALDGVGGWEAKLKVLEPFPRPCSGVC